MVDVRIRRERDFYGFWNLKHYHSKDNYKFLSTVLNLDKNNYCSLPARSGHADEHIGKWFFNHSNDTVKILIETPDSVFDGV